MYAIHFRRKLDNPSDYTLIAEGSLEEMAKKRVVTGDLVVNKETGKVVSDPSWLFSWEKADENCWAQRAIRCDNAERY